jgi:hypothetical protein
MPLFELMTDFNPEFGGGGCFLWPLKGGAGRRCRVLVPLNEDMTFAGLK